MVYLMGLAFGNFIFLQFFIDGFFDEMSLTQRNYIYFLHDSGPSQQARVVNDSLSLNLETNWIELKGPETIDSFFVSKYERKKTLLSVFHVHFLKHNRFRLFGHTN
ncbi:hypothetical protein HHI36_019809 [Cryptolaemus montrouzieri]|uniref:Uncharacterized protein n=1 Tax=Cryptolaemus montrouzieri TaxID=559131 RepID=A0ABD2N957_9CUCU